MVECKIWHSTSNRRLLDECLIPTYQYFLGEETLALAVCADWARWRISICVVGGMSFDTIPNSRNTLLQCAMCQCAINYNIHPLTHAVTKHKIIIIQYYWYLKYQSILFIGGFIKRTGWLFGSLRWIAISSARKLESNAMTAPWTPDSLRLAANSWRPIELSHFMTRVLLQTKTSFKLSWLWSRRVSSSYFE